MSSRDPQGRGKEAPMTNLTMQADGPRLYILGSTYPLRTQLRSLGAHWDADRRAWWVGVAKRPQVETLVAQLADGDASAQPTQTAHAPDPDARVLGRVRYQDREYYWLATSHDGSRMLLAYRNGSRQFWADGAKVHVTKRYGRQDGRTGRVQYPTLSELLERAAEWRQMSDEARARRQAIREAGGVCRCARPLDEGDGTCLTCGYALA
jgi:hypothetical protein